MLIQITNTCTEGCKHCMQDSLPEPMMMSMETFNRTIDVARHYGVLAMLLSGGEPTEHPQFAEMLETCARTFKVASLITNGLWITTEKRKVIEDLLKRYDNIYIQITSVKGIYKDYDLIMAHKAEFEAMPRTAIHDGELNILALGRATENEKYREMAKYSLGTTSCFSSALISAQMPLGQAIKTMEMRMKFCHPLVDWKGKMHWSESWLCPAFAYITDDYATIEAKARRWRPCGRCEGYKKLLMNNTHQYVQAKEILNIKSPKI